MDKYNGLLSKVSRQYHILEEPKKQKMSGRLVLFIASAG